jgi:RimJ/RimL family protein N-acetyltransferase
MVAEDAGTWVERLQSERLVLIALSDVGLQLASENWQALEAALGLKPSAYSLSAAEQRAVESKRRKLAVDPSLVSWHTYWVLVEEEQRRAVGMCGFKGAPVEGEVEVGYGTFPGYRRRGYMTEGLARLLQWAFAQDRALRVVAETDPENRASQRVLEKVGFSRLTERNREEAIWWVYQ